MKYKLLGRSGLRVSELCLGTMTFGEEWGYGASKKESQAIFEAFCNAGGNFIDTANRYTEGTSEKYLGEFVNSERDSYVLATKYSLYNHRDDVNASGNHRKNMIRSVEGSLRRLKTDYLDLLYLHAWDYTTPLEEVMRGLDDLVHSGKVHYIGISDTPAWIISRANLLADLRGWHAFVGLQTEYSLIQRTPERDLLPMAKALDIGVTAWAPLGGGALTGKYLKGTMEAKRLKDESARLSEQNRSIAAEVVEIADELGCAPSHVAINWVRQQGGVTIPIIGSRNVNQIKSNLNCLEQELGEQHLQKLNEVSAIELGFPHDFLKSDGVQDVLFGGNQDNILNHRS